MNRIEFSKEYKNNYALAGLAQAIIGGNDNIKIRYFLYQCNEHDKRDNFNFLDSFLDLSSYKASERKVTLNSERVSCTKYTSLRNRIKIIH